MNVIAENYECYRRKLRMLSQERGKCRNVHSPQVTLIGWMTTDFIWLICRKNQRLSVLSVLPVGYDRFGCILSWFLPGFGSPRIRKAVLLLADYNATEKTAFNIG